MKYLFLVVSLLVSFAFSSGPGGYGLPPYLWQTTFALNVTPGQSNLPRNHGDMARFVNKIHTATASKHPSIHLSHAYDLRDADATYTNFNSGLTTGSEMFYFAGHGNYGTVRFYDYEVGIGSIPLSGWTRWGFLVSCLALNQKNAYHSSYSNAFSGGVHALFGYESDHRWYLVTYNCGIFGCSHYRSEDKWDKFANKWITNGMYMYDAWFLAVKESSWDQAGEGVAPAVVFSYGYVEGTWYIGGMETLPTVYNEMVAPNLSKSHYYAVYGTPYYNNAQ